MATKKKAGSTSAAEMKAARERFLRSRAAEKSYSRQLNSVAKQVQAIIAGLITGDEIDLAVIRKALFDYSILLAPWARSVANYMLADVARRDKKAWFQASREIGVALRAELDHAPTGALLSQLMQQQVDYITSIPKKAAEEVHEMVLANLTASERSETMIPCILALGAKSKARARLIARTEVARAGSLLTQARAEYVGSEGYLWRTVRDGNVRDSHAEMEGKYVRWDSPPTLSDGTTTHAGQIYNCRCWAEPILPEMIE